MLGGLEDVIYQWVPSTFSLERFHDSGVVSVDMNNLLTQIFRICANTKDNSYCLTKDNIISELRTVLQRNVLPEELWSGMGQINRGMGTNHGANPASCIFPISRGVRKDFNNLSWV